MVGDEDHFGKDHFTVGQSSRSIIPRAPNKLVGGTTFGGKFEDRLVTYDAVGWKSCVLIRYLRNDTAESDPLAKL